MDDSTAPRCAASSRRSIAVSVARPPVRAAARRLSDGMELVSTVRMVTASKAFGCRGDVLVVVSVDTEEDNWVPARTGITLDNIRARPRLSRFFGALDVRATFFTTYQVATDPRAADILREIAAGGGAEIGAHLHPWNTPPVEEALSGRNTLMKNLAPGLQLAKLECLTAALGDVFGAAPKTSRSEEHTSELQSPCNLVCRLLLEKKKKKKIPKQTPKSI